MAKKPKLDFKNLADYRKALGLNQSDFWKKFGVTQSGGSRYESGRDLPKSVAALLWLADGGKVSEKDLAAAIKAASK